MVPALHQVSWGPRHVSYMRLLLGDGAVSLGAALAKRRRALFSLLCLRTEDL